MLLFAGPPWLSHKFGYGSTWTGWDTWTTLKVTALSCLWSFIAHPVSQSMDESHLSSLSHRSYRAIFLLCSHRPFFSRRQSPSTTTMVSLSLTSLTPPMPFPSSSLSPHHSTTQLQPSESGEHRAAQVLGIANSPMHSSIHVSLHGLTIIKPLHSSPTIVLSPILFESNISSQTKSQIAEQLHGPNMPCLDFSTG